MDIMKLNQGLNTQNISNSIFITSYHYVLHFLIALVHKYIQVIIIMLL